MAFTRAHIRSLAKESGVELPKELEDALISEYTTSRDAYAEEQVKAALENAPKPAEVKVEESEAYKNLKKEYDDYKSAQETKESQAAKEAAARAFFESRSIKEANLRLAMRSASAEINSLELDKEGKIKNEKVLDDLVKGDLAGLVHTTTVTGANTATPPANNGGGALTKADILKIKDTTERQAAFAQYLQNQKGN